MSHELLSELIRNYGYLAILIGTFLEGETILLLGGLAAHMGFLELPWVMAAALTGSFTGDQLYYYLGRRYGPRIIARRLSWKESAAKVYRHLRRHQNLLILSFRFFYGLRNVTPFAVGAARISRSRFFILNLIGAVVWAIAFASVGYLSGEAFRLILDDFKRYQLYVLLGLLVAGILFWLIMLIRRRQRALAQKS
jgi:membrane protein DedA with SNARE-associated domain